MNKTTAPLPLDLASASTAYCQRLADLARESQQRWLALGQRLASDSTNQCLSTLAPLKFDGNWQQIAQALGELTRKQYQCQLDAAQAISHAALQDQATLAAGVSEAGKAWLRSASAAAVGNPAASPLTRIWSTYFDEMASACSAAREASLASALRSTLPTAFSGKRSSQSTSRGT